MADLVQTAASVAPISGVPNQLQTVVAGAAITAGQVVYKDFLTGNWFPATGTIDANHAGQYGCGIALDSAPGAGQYFTVLLAGQINLGAALSIGQVYAVSCSGIAGNIAPYSDLIGGNFVTILGVAVSASVLVMPWSGPLVSNVSHA